MRTSILLLVTLIVFFASHTSSVWGQDGKGCEVQATVEIENSQGRPSESKASVKIQEGQSPFKYLFYDTTTGRLLQKDFSKSSLENLKKGSYYCVVADNRGCIKKIQFQIQ